MDRANLNNRRGERSREEILDAAARIMGERGYAATSIAVVSREIGLAKSVVFHHFHTKSGLLSAVMERGLNDFFDAMRTAHANPPDVGSHQELLSWFFARSADVLAERQEFLRLHMLLILSADALDAEVADTIDKVRRDGRQHMNRMIRESFRDAGPDIAQVVADKLDHLAMGGIDGAFLASQAEQGGSMRDDMDLLAQTVALAGERIVAQIKTDASESYESS